MVPVVRSDRNPRDETGIYGLDTPRRFRLPFMTLIRTALYALILLASSGSAWGADPFAGTWKLNLAKSKYPPPQPKEEVVVAVDQGDNLLITISGTTADGKPIALKYTDPKKEGLLSFIEGDPPSGVSVVSKRIDDHTMDDILNIGGEVVLTSHFVVSPDGRTLTVTRKGTLNRVEVWDRQ